MALERGHAVVLVLVVLIGLAAAALLGVGRPRVEPDGQIDPADAGVSAAVVATGRRRPVC